MRILVTGGAGYIGSHVVLAALDRGYDVVIFDNLSSSNKININPKAQFIKGTITSNRDLTNLFESNKFDGIVHLAGSKAAGESMLNPKRYAINNIAGSLNLLNKCVEFEVSPFIFSSSAAVYGKPEYIPIDEIHLLKPSNYYGFSKLSIESNLKWYSKSYGIKYASLRYFNAAGYDKRIIGIENNPKNLIPIVMETAIGKRPYVSIFGNNYRTKDGTGVRDYVHVNDLATAHINSFEYLLDKKQNLTINLGSEIGYSVFDIIEITKNITKKNIRFKIDEPRDGDVAELIASCSLAKDLIGWDQMESNLERIIYTTWSIYKDLL